MAHFAELDEANNVLRVIVVDNKMLLENGRESEIKGITFCQKLFGDNTTWVQTSYGRSFRKNYAGIGFSYDPQRDAFISPKPEGEGWVLDEETCQWRNPEFEAVQAAINIGVTHV